MKKFAIASLTAIALAVVSHEEAKAWFNFSAGGSFNTNISWGGRNVCHREAEPWPNTYGIPAFNNYGPAAGVPAYPVGGCGMTSYGQGYQQLPPPAPKGGSGSGAPTSYNNLPQPMGYGFGAMGYGYGLPYGYNMPYAQPVAYQYGMPETPAYWYGR